MSLAAKFDLSYHDNMQDWEWEVADSSRFEEFLATYHSSSLSDDEKFSLMEILIQCVEDLGLSSNADLAWGKLKPLLLDASWLHGSSIEYWARHGENDLESSRKTFAIGLPARSLRRSFWQSAVSSHQGSSHVAISNQKLKPTPQSGRA
jgi:hypothetical protein